MPELTEPMSAEMVRARLDVLHTYKDQRELLDDWRKKLEAWGRWKHLKQIEGRLGHKSCPCLKLIIELEARDGN